MGVSGLGKFLANGEARTDPAIKSPLRESRSYPVILSQPPDCALVVEKAEDQRRYLRLENPPTVTRVVASIVD